MAAHHLHEPTTAGGLGFIHIPTKPRTNTPHTRFASQPHTTPTSRWEDFFRREEAGERATPPRAGWAAVGANSTVAAAAATAVRANAASAQDAADKSLAEFNRSRTYHSADPLEHQNYTSTIRKAITQAQVRQILRFRTKS